SIEKSQYGMLFTTIQVNGNPVNAIIDFGDPNRLQLSETLVKKMHIPVVKTDRVAMDVVGNQYEVNDGIIDSVQVGEWILKNETFSSSPGEMELISRQIDTEFHAVIGWGFFSDYYITMNYHNNQIIVSAIREIPTQFSFSGQLDNQSSYLILQSKINGVPANLILDTGAPLTLLDSSFFANNVFPSTDTQVVHSGDTIPLKTISTTFRSSSVDLSYLIYELSAINFLAVGVIGGDVFDEYQVYIEPVEKWIYFTRENKK
ncbi:MAG: aspartyl protease family protein, partial [Bacteroidetes bacterium]|nr:aspartyl protease family protein [Bacteroidota bacterium]